VKKWRYGHTRADYEGTWQRKVWSTSISYLSASCAVVRC
jgi:hypothetical protein